jgi:adenylate cyclase
VISSLVRWWSSLRASVHIAPYIAIAAIVALGVVGMRSAGWLESAELEAYDRYVRLRYSDSLPDARVVLVTVTEHDVLANGWPLSDRVLARAIQAVAQHTPRAIGLDIYRDVPVPPGTQELEALFLAERRVVALMKVGQAGSSGVRAPRALRGTDQAGFSDMVVDPGGIVRRGLLFLDDGTTISYSFALRLALLSMQTQGIVPRPDPREPSHLRLGRVTVPPLESDDGGYAHVDARGYQFLLDFKGARRPFASIDLASLLAGAFPPEFLRDKIVLIGVVAESMPDNFYTPFNRDLGASQSTPGVEIHAHAASQILRMGLDGVAPMAVLPKAWEWLWISFWSALGVLAGYTLLSPWKFWSGVAGGLIVLAALALGAFVLGWWIPIVPPALAWPCAAVVGNQYKVRIDKKRLAKNLGLFVPPHVVEQLTQKPGAFASIRESLGCACLVTDAAAYTTLSENLPSTDLAPLLNQYFETLFRPVLELKGFVSDIIGDSMLALWPDRSEGKEVRLRACLACLDALPAVERFNARSPIHKLPTRFGIHFGPVTLGLVGALTHYEYRAVGDTVNASNRVQGLNKRLGTRLLASEAVVQGMEELLLRDLGRFRLKGKTVSIRVYEIVCKRSDATEADLLLCKQFATALDAFQSHTQDSAREQFERLLSQFPQDGPSVFYSDLVRKGIPADGIVDA